MIGELAALGTAILWAIAAVLYKRALLDTKPISANIVRCAFTGVILIACLIVIGRITVLASVSAQTSILASLSGVVGLCFGDTLYMVSLKLAGVARAVSITSTYPLFNIVLAIFLRRETFSLWVVLSAVTIVLGIWFLSWGEKKDVEALHKRKLIRGVASALATAVIWAVSISMINMAVLLPETGSLDYALAVNTLRNLAAAVFLLASAPITDRNFHFLKMQRGTVLSLVSGGIAALAVGWFLLIVSFLYIPESQAVPISSTSPLFAAIAGMVFLREPLTPKIVAGLTLIVVGISLIFMV
ncbi:MAG: DMT family transporter [Candidatus Bathyarchaeota archaeon]|nr:MAG: DMT family transporter [Candidatus Bathyarchaeota archaeon]